MTLHTDDAIAHIEITQVLYRYCRGVDRGDRELIRSVYHPDASDDHGSWKGAGVDFADYIVDSMDGATIAAQHQITNTLIEVDGDSAACESYFLAFHPTRDQAGDETLAIAAGRYLDRFERRDGAWRIADRRVVLDWTRENVEGVPWAAQVSFAAAGRREADPSWGFIAGAS